MRSSRNLLVQVISLLAFGLSAVHAQATDPVPLKNWPAPLSWQATTPHEVAAAHGGANTDTIRPQLTTSGGGTQLGVLVAITPCRLVDTRSDMPVPFGSGTASPLTWPTASQTTIPATSLTGGPYYYGSGTSNPVTNSCNALPAALAYSASITVIPQPTLSWLSVCPTGTSTASCSAIAALTDYQNDPVLSNAAVIPATAAGSFDVFVKNATQLIIDINGYYMSPNAVALGVGTAVAPSLTFAGDSTTGLYSPGAGTVDIATAGVNRLTVAPNGNVGIGTLSPAFSLDVVGQINGNNLATTGFSPGVSGTSHSSQGAGVSGFNTDTSGTNYPTGVSGGVSGATGAGVNGNANMAGAVGVNGFNSATTGYAVGVSGGTASTNGAGVSGNSNRAGVFGTVGFNSATSGYAVGTEGASSSPNGVGLLGVDWNCSGGTGCALVSGTALQLQTATTGMLIVGQAGTSGANNNTAVTVFSVDGQGDGYFKGNLNVGGTISKGGGSFRIDHPLDPENKYLYHSFVESPDMKNIYDGVVTLDENGEARVQLPNWFEALNQDYRYQLTCIGTYAPVYVGSEVSNNEFRIAGGSPGLKVSWQISGIRHDHFANTHRIPVEQEKPANERSISPMPAVFNGATSGTAQHP